MGDVVFNTTETKLVENDGNLKVIRPNSCRQIFEEFSRVSSPTTSASSATQMASNDESDNDDKTTYFPSPKLSFVSQTKRVSSCNNNNNNNGNVLPIVTEVNEESVLLRNNNRKRIRVVKQQVCYISTCVQVLKWFSSPPPPHPLVF